MDLLQSDRTRLEEQRELKGRRVGRIRDSLDSEDETNRNLLENIQEVRAQYVQNLLTFGMSTMVYRPGLPLTIVALKILASLYVLPVSV